MNASDAVALGSFVIGALGAMYGAFHQGRRQRARAELRRVHRERDYCRAQYLKLQEENLELMRELLRAVDHRLD